MMWDEFPSNVTWSCLKRLLPVLASNSSPSLYVLESEPYMLSLSPSAGRFSIRTESSMEIGSDPIVQTYSPIPRLFLLTTSVRLIVFDPVSGFETERLPSKVRWSVCVLLDPERSNRNVLFPVERNTCDLSPGKSLRVIAYLFVGSRWPCGGDALPLRSIRGGAPGRVL